MNDTINKDESPPLEPIPTDSVKIGDGRPPLAADFGFQNPYPGTRHGMPNWRRLGYDVDGRDVDEIKSVLVQHGSVQTAHNLFIQALATYVRTNNLSLRDKADFEQHILDCCKFAAGRTAQRDFNPAYKDAYKLTGTSTGRCSSNQSPPEEPRGDDGRGTPTIRPGSQSEENREHAGTGKQANAEGSSKSGRKGKQVGPVAKER